MHAEGVSRYDTLRPYHAPFTQQLFYMESLPERSATNGPPAERQLPPGGGRVERITQHTQGLVDDLKTWVELRIKLAQIEMRERVEERANDLAIKAIMGVLGALAGLFGLTTAGLGLSALFVAIGLSRPLSYFLGFLTLTLFLAGIAGIIWSAQPQLVHLNKKAAVDEKKVKRGAHPLEGQRDPRS